MAVVREGGAAEGGVEENIQGLHGHGHWLHQGFPRAENISGVTLCLTTPLTPGWQVLERHNPLCLGSSPRTPNLSLLSLSLSLWQGFSVFSSSQLLQDVDSMLFLTRVLKAVQGWGIYHPSDHRRCHADMERHTIYVTYVLLLPVSQPQESSQQ